MFYTIIMKADSQDILKFETQAAAAERFHTEMAYAYNMAISTTCMIVDKFGAVHKTESYTAPMEIATEE